MANLKLQHIYKVYDGRVKAVNDLNLTIEDKDFVVFVGPSGCGKSTTLRMIAGLEEITSGQLYIDDVLVNEKAPKDRDIAMVFQNYALYPHKTVYENMAFGLRLAGLKPEEVKARIEKASEILELTPYLTRKPRALSGGQKQRVALGRSIVREPKVFLLDEPLSNLDAKLRVQMRSEITKLHRRLGTTFIYVTHDQVEAMTMGNRIVVMKDGFIQQIDSPTNLYDHPDNVFVATFLGTPQMNLYQGMIAQQGEHYVATIQEDDNITSFSVSPSIIHKLVNRRYLNLPILIGVRPEDIYEVDEKEEQAIPLLIEIQEKRGSELIVSGVIKGTSMAMTAKLDGRRVVLEGETIYVRIQPERIHLFDEETKQRIAEVITFNELEGHFYPHEKSVKIANQAVSLSDERMKRMLPEYLDKDQVIGVRIPCDQFKLSQAKANDLQLEGVIKSIEQDKAQTIAFVQLPNHPTLVAIRLPKAHYELDQVLQLYVDVDALELFDHTFKTKLVALHPFTSNSTICRVVKEKGKSYAKFAEFKLLLDQDYEVGNYQITIPYDAFTIVSKQEEIKDKTMKFKCVNESPLGEHTILYANLKAFPDYLSIKAPKDATCFTKGKITFQIKRVELKKI
jgi:multiple sugar transport system ATP-binding protein